MVVSHEAAPAPATERRPIDRVIAPVQRFLQVEAAGGILLLSATAIALFLANSPWAEAWSHFWHTYVKASFGDHEIKLSLAHFVNDGLMAIFFFVVGLEIKREVLVGELASIRQSSVPIIAAIGGMVVPALVFTGVRVSMGGAGIHGWGIPMATDIAFAVGIMAMLGPRVPLSLKVFLTALAIVDDMGAVLVIAIFYTSQISLTALGVAGSLLLLALGANLAHIRSPVVYGLIGLGMWLMLLQSGVHATIGGVLLALVIPSKFRIQVPAFVSFAERTIALFRDAGDHHNDLLRNARRQQAVHRLEQACEHVQTPLSRLEHGLHPWVAFIIMPVFALANAGVPLGSGFSGGMGSGLGLGVALGLLLGKPIGITLSTWLAVRSGLGRIPGGASWAQVVGAGFLGGIGFTMSLFIANLAFRDDGSAELTLAKTGILSGSLLAGLIGFLLLSRSGRSAGALAGDAAPAEVGAKTS